MFLDLLSGVAGAEVDGNATNLLCLLETLRNTVDDVNFRGPAKDSRVGCHQSDGSCTEDGDRLAGLEAGKLDSVPSLGSRCE